MLSPVLPLSVVAEALGMSDRKAAAFIELHGVPTLSTGSQTLVDAGICERVARRELGDSAGDRIHALRAPSVGARSESRAVPAVSVPDPDETIEDMLRLAIEEHGGVLSYTLYRKWAAATGRHVYDIGTIRRVLEVPTWTEALRVCGGRRGVTTPADRAEARQLIRRALADHDGQPSLKDYREWAIAHGARWIDPQRVARAAGFRTFGAACSQLQGEEGE